MKEPERRYLPIVDNEDAIRVETRDDGKKLLSGISPPWESLSVDLGGFREKFTASAFDKILGRHRNDPRGSVDVPFLFTPDASFITGRTSNGRLTLEKTPKGLGYTHDPLLTQQGRDLVLMVEDRTIYGASFAFSVRADGEQWTEDGKGGVLRTIVEADGLYDISAVTRAAYPTASVGMRSLDAWKAARGVVAASGEGNLTVSLDFDGTFTAAPGLWRSFIQDATARGTRVVCITRREDNDENRSQLLAAFGDVYAALDRVVMCGAATQKRDAAAAAGLEVDIWIDDSPEKIPAAGSDPVGNRSVKVSTLAGQKASAAAAALRLHAR
jgi:HK97 family phage prohead protease